MKRISNLTREEKAEWLKGCSAEQLVSSFETFARRYNAGLSITYMSLEERQEDYDLAKAELLRRLESKS